MSKLQSYEGFVEDVSEGENRMIDRMQDKLKESKHLMSYLQELYALRIKYGFEKAVKEFYRS
jgi:hypothetical protein